MRAERVRGHMVAALLGPWRPVRRFIAEEFLWTDFRSLAYFGEHRVKRIRRLLVISAIVYGWSEFEAPVGSVVTRCPP